MHRTGARWRADSACSFASRRPARHLLRSRSVNDFIVEISFDAADASLDEIVQARLFMLACSGSSSAERGGTTTVSAYFGSAEERDAAIASLEGIDGLTLHAVDAERVNWLERYQQSLVAMTIGDRFIVAPDASLLDDASDRIKLVVPQEQAFGTGSHETTSLCLELLETIDVAGKHGLDVGSGSGILAMAMLRLGASKVIAFDNDVDAYGALRDNRMRNGVAEPAMPLFIGSVEALRGGTFDVMTMNILPEVIIALLPNVVFHIAPRAKAVLSGILTTRSDEVVRAAAVHGLHLEQGRERGEWWAGVFGS